MNWFDELGVKLREQAPVVGTRLLVAILIIAIGYLVARTVAKMTHSAVLRRPRGATLAPLARSLVYILLFVGAVVAALDHLGVPVTTIIAGAGVAGLAVGFGAQSLVKDVISGFFHIVEGVLAVGDVAQIGDVTGVVEEVGLRVTKVRTFNGQLWYVPNGTIDRVGNFNRDWTRAVVEVGIAYEQDARRAMATLKRIGDEYRKERPEMVLEEPTAEGALGLNASNVTVRLVLKVKPQEHWGIERELRLRVKEAFEREHIEIPYPRQVVLYQGKAPVVETRGDGNGNGDAASAD